MGATRLQHSLQYLVSCVPWHQREHFGETKKCPYQGSSMWPKLQDRATASGAGSGPALPSDKTVWERTSCFPLSPDPSSAWLSDQWHPPDTLNPEKRNLWGQIQTRTHRFYGSKTALQGTWKIPAATLFYIPGSLFQGGNICTTSEGTSLQLCDARPLIKLTQVMKISTAIRPYRPFSGNGPRILSQESPYGNQPGNTENKQTKRKT